MTSRKLILSTALLLLSGCGGEDSPSQASNSIMAPLARDAFEVLSKDGGQTTVSLWDVVIDPQGLPLTLESVVATGQSCEAPTTINAQALTFTVDNAEPELCFYRYSVKNHPAQASLAKVSEANSYVLKSASSLLPPLSESTQVGTPIIISIAAVAGYTLDSEVVVLGDGGAVADSTASTIAYTPNAQGVTRLVYTMTSDDGMDVMTGTVDVAVSDVGNTAPSVVPVELTTQYGDAGYYNINQSYTIDLSGYVSDADDDDVQLIQVEAWNANVALAAPDEPSNLSFTFQTSTQGAHYVTYVVSDHRGGYGVEQVRVETYDLSSVATWSDIQKGAKLFSAPLTQSEALVSEISFTSSHVDSNGSTVATFSFEQAQSLCESKGHLPSSANLTELVGFEGGPAAKGWPVNIAYWANDGGTPELISLTSGATGTESTSGHYVTCLNEGGFIIDTEASDFEAVANGAEKATIAVKLTFNGEPVEGQLVEASTSNTNVTFDATTGTTDSGGLTSFALSSLVAEEMPVNITYSGETLAQNVTFIADEATSSLTLSVTKDGATADALDGNEVEVTMVDINTNPLLGRTVAFESDTGDSVTITPAPEGTDAAGKQRASVVWSGGLLTEDAIVNVTAKFTPLSTGTEITDTAAVTFTIVAPAICGSSEGVSNVDDTDPTNATGYCLKVATDSDGKWFTSTPSLAVMEVLGYKVDNSDTNSGDTYASTYTESGTYGPSGGEFARFRQDGATATNPSDGGDGTDGQFDRWCQKLNTLEFGGKSNWRRPTRGELEAFYQKYEDEGAEYGLWSARGWPVYYNYWASTLGGSGYSSVVLRSGYVGTFSPSSERFASCASKNP
ncbi:Ig-like domain-containing protein [Vibrio hyugaensis]|uniref:Ig-like domain-containing protein n=1 Tax=Vibrio hyugaensis TaxID=1534743 RepID=UPI0009E22C76|nr:Ig-like domain-containing protein [Vibrio hyugaensis]